MREKVERHVHGRVVEYGPDRWKLLAELRERAARVQRAIPASCLTYGSVARGDVSPTSDVDVVVMEAVPSFALELAVSKEFHVLERRLTMASPNAVPKASLMLSDGSNVSWSLLPTREREEDFYRFGGSIDATASEPIDRVPGVSKRLILVEPLPEGHRETSVIGAEVEVAKALSLSIDVVEERVRVLVRRDQVGRTGVFRSLTVDEDETFEQVLEGMADTTPAVRRQLRNRRGR